MANPSIVTGQVISSNNGSTTNFAGSVTAHNAIIVLLYDFSSTIAPSDNKGGNTWAQKGADAVDVNNNHVGVWYCADIINGGSAFGIGHSTSPFAAYEVKDFDTGLFDGSEFTKILAATSSAGTFTSNAISVTNSGALILWGLIDQNTATWTVSGTSTQDVNMSAKDRNVAAHLTNASNAATVQCDYAATASNTAAMIGVVIKAAAAGATVLKDWRSVMLPIITR